MGVLIPGIGAVTTTFIAGLEAIKRGLGKPIGSLTQLGAIRLGKRTEGRSPFIRDFVPLAGVEDMVVGGWDIFEDNAFAALSRRLTTQDRRNQNISHAYPLIVNNYAARCMNLAYEMGEKKVTEAVVMAV